MDRKRKADDPCDDTVRKKAKLGDVTDMMDRKRTALDSLDSGDVTDMTDRTQKADDPCDVTMVTARKRAKFGNITECVSSSAPAPHGSSQSNASAPTNYFQTGMTGGTAIGSNVAAVMTVNNAAAECSLLQHLITETELKIKSKHPTRHVSTYTDMGCIQTSEGVRQQKYVVMVDDIFGRTNLIQSSLDEWRQKFDLVWPLVESGQIWLVMTSRPEIISQGEPEIFGYEIINKAKEIILDEGKYRLQESEKLKFLEKLCGKYVRKEDMKEIANMDTTLGFPQCCTFFAANKDARLKGVEFFKKPFEFIKDLIECVKKTQPEVYFVLLLVFMNEGRLSMKELMSAEHEDKFERQFKTILPFCILKKDGLSKGGIKHVAKSVCGIYLLEASRCFLFSHRSIYDVLFVAVCEDSPDLGIKMSTPVMLLEFIRINKQKLERCKQRNVVFLDEEDYPILADKLREYLSHENTRYVVLSHPALQDTEFLRVIFHEWKTDDIYQLCRHNGGKVVKDIALPLSGKLGLPRTVNILEYNLFLSYVIMNHMKEFASRIIQLLCRYDSEDVHPVLNEALLCALFTCEKDLATALLSSGAKPNMLCFISLCNWPQLDTNTSSTIISQIEDNETNLKLLLSIAVISCNKTVIRVLIQKLTALSGNHDQFYSHCLELLLKINGNCHKDIPQLTTNAGHEILEVMTLLEEGGGKLDSRKISLASSHKDPSVLRKLLLRSRDDINVTDEFGRTQLHLACMYGGADGVDLLLKHGSELSVDTEGSTPFHYALKSCVDQKEKLKLLLNKNSSDHDEDFVNLTDYMKCTALHYAAQLLDSDCVKMLVEAQADTNILDVSKQSPLFYVSKECVPVDMYYGNTASHRCVMTDKDYCHKVIQTLLEKGADAGIKNQERKTPLHCAALNQCMECVELLLPLSDVNARDSYGDTALHCSSWSHEPHSHGVIQALLGKGADAGIKNKKGYTPLHCAAQNQCMECVELLLPLSNVNTQVGDGRTALLLSLQSNVSHSHDVIQALLEKGADAGIKNKKGETPLHCAAQNQCMECVELLLPLSDVNIQGGDGRTALLLSLQSNVSHSHDVIQALLEKGADAGIRNKKGETLLHCAALNQCLECVELLLPVSDVNAKDSYGTTALHCSVLSYKPHSHEVIQALLEKGADAGIKNKKGETPLHCAAQNQCMECVELLLPLSDVNTQGGDGRTALLLSFQSNVSHSHDVIQALLEKGADAGIRNKKGETLLHCAALNQCLECVELLLPVSDVNAKDSYGTTALHCSVLSYKPHSHEVIQALLEKGADAGIKNKKGETPLHCAAQNQCMECVELLLPLSNVNTQVGDGRTALLLSLQSNVSHSHDVIQALLEKGADAGIKNKKGETPLHCAAQNQCMECVELLLPLSNVNTQGGDGRTALLLRLQSNVSHSHDVIQALLEKGADVGILNKDDETPLHCAARKQCMECVKLLLPLSDVNAQDSDGDTALHCSSWSCTPHFHKIIQALLDKEADVKIKNKKGETPLHRAALNQCMECVELLLPLSDVNAQDSDGDTALHCSFLSNENHSHEMIQALLDKEADVKIKNKEGETSLHCAAFNQCIECVELLLPLSDVNALNSDGDTALHCSFLSNEPHSHEVIQALLDKEADVKIKNKKGQTLLHCAARKQCMECVELLLPLSDVNALNSDGGTALHCSLLSNKKHSHEVIQALLDKEADVKIKNKKGETLLHCAARKQCMKCVKLLLPLSDVNALNSDGDTALHCSSWLCRPHFHKVIQALLDKEADVKIKNKKGETPLHRAALNQCMKCVKLLLPLSDVNALNNDGDTALHCSFLSNEPHSHKVIQALVDKAADVKIKNKKGETLLHLAASYQCMECVKLLLPLSDVNALNSDGDTALHCSFLSFDPHSHEVIQALLDKEADVKIKNKKGETLLHCAALNECMECVKLLLPLSDVNALNSDGDTALHYSFLSYEPHSHVIQALLDKEADVKIKNKKGETALHCAARNQCMKCVKLLLPLSDVNALNSDGDTALHCSFLSYEPHSHDVMQALLDKEADVKIKDKRGETLLHRAALNQCLECVKLLLPLSDVNGQDSYGDTALHFQFVVKCLLSNENHSHDVIQALLDMEADVNIKNKKGETLLHCAALNQCIETLNQCIGCVELLLPLSDVNALNSDGDTALHCSLLSNENHSHDVIQALLDMEADVNIKNKKGETLLHCAALNQCIECVELLLPLSDVNALNSDGDTALHCFLLSYDPHSHEVIQALLEKGADAGIRNKKGETLLHCAALNQCLECVELLLPLSDVNARDSYGDTALHCSFLSNENHSHEMIKALLDKEADVKIKNKKGQTLLHRAAMNQCIECVKLLFPLSDVNALNSDGDTGLHCSFLSNEPHSHDVIQALLDKEADVKIKNKKGETLLHRAARKQCMECVKLLLPLSDVNAQNSDGDTALHCSFLSNEPHSHDVIQALLDKEADVKIKNKKGETLLHCAARKQCMECVELLLPLSDVNGQDSYGDTALHCSFLSNENHSHEMIQALLDKDADVKIKNKKGETFLHCAALNQCIECVELLLPLSDVNALNSDGDTALHCSLLSNENHYHEVIQALLDKEADVNIKNKKGETLLHCAALDQCLECVELLLPLSDVNARDSYGDTALHCSFLSNENHSHENDTHC
ncbi:uncharacterized protein LOC124274831 [Haliotis rubra]|uniref:uncharacterized protein LOC124274831 n=1 Tax=Haliotis rubra TaxID=36100 RepID=UPI001EE571D0|nr:uncharacterized protein LOC124274831 [Haliotis rubra]